MQSLATDLVASNGAAAAAFSAWSFVDNGEACQSGTSWDAARITCSGADIVVGAWVASQTHAILQPVCLIQDPAGRFIQST